MVMPRQVSYQGILIAFKSSVARYLMKLACYSKFQIKRRVQQFVKHEWLA
jgi:hypothetical protein